MTKITKALSLAAVCGGLLLGMPAQAQTLVLEQRDRDILSDWVIYNNKGCPVGSTWVKRERFLGGLTRPSYRCVVPKDTKIIYYKPGTVLPTTVTYMDVPSYVTAQLPSPPPGHMYVMADHTVYLIDSQSRNIVDTVSVVGVE